MEENKPTIEVEEPYPKTFDIEVYQKNKKKHKLVIKAVSLAASDTRKSDIYEIEIKGRGKIRELLEKFDYDFEILSNSLRIMNNRMILLNPKALDRKRLS